MRPWEEILERLRYLLDHGRPAGLPMSWLPVAQPDIYVAMTSPAIQAERTNSDVGQEVNRLLDELFTMSTVTQPCKDYLKALAWMHYLYGLDTGSILSPFYESDGMSLFNPSRHAAYEKAWLLAHSQTSLVTPELIAQQVAEVLSWTVAWLNAYGQDEEVAMLRDLATRHPLFGHLRPANHDI